MEHAAHLAAPLRHHGFRLQRHRHQSAAVAGILLTQFGEHEAAGGALHQLGPERGFQGERRLLMWDLETPEPACGRRDTLLADQGVRRSPLGKTLQHGITRVDGGPHYSRAARRGIGSAPERLEDLPLERVVGRILVGAIARNQLAIAAHQVFVEVPVGGVTVGGGRQPL